MIIGLIVFTTMFGSANLFAQDKHELSFEELGFSLQEAQPSPELQQRLEERRFYLKQHQVWGLIATGAMGLALLSGGEGNLPPEHAYFAGLAAVSYGASAYTAWMAPTVDGMKVSGGSAWHRRLSWIHVPGMILTPLLGYMAAQKLNKDEKLQGLEKYHKDVAGVTAVALALSVLTVSFEF